MKSNLLILSLIVFLGYSAHSQNFMQGYDAFSHKKPAYITLKDGTKVEGEIDDLDRKKGNISEITLKVNGKKKTFEPEEIKEMYLPASGLDKFSKQMEVGTNLSKDLNMDRLGDGYGFFEFTPVEIKGKVQPLLMQLVNPGFHNKIKVYFDPFAKETMSVGIGPMKVGGLDKSYFVKIGDKPAFKVTKGDYDDQAKDLFKDCASAMKALKATPDWNKFELLVYTHFTCKN